jgi:hypothetical protein
LVHGRSIRDLEYWYSAAYSAVRVTGSGAQRVCGTIPDLGNFYPFRRCKCSRRQSRKVIGGQKKQVQFAYWDQEALKTLILDGMPKKSVFNV